MPYSERFILTTDFATLKNDNSGNTTVTFPASQSVPAAVGSTGGYTIFTSDLTIGVQGALTRTQISSSKDSNIPYTVRRLSYQRSGIVSGSPASYTIDAFTFRLNANTIRFQVMVMNPYSSALTTATGAETFTFFINTFLPPYTT